MHEPVHPVNGGMGAIPYENGVAFRVWAPHADRVFVMGTFSDYANGDVAAAALDHNGSPAQDVVKIAP